MVTEAGLRAATDQSTSEVSLTLLRITSPELPQEDLDRLFFVLNDEDIVSGGVTYHKSGFQYKPPGEGESANSIGTLRLGIVDRTLVQLIKGLTAFPSVYIREVLASAPDIPQEEFPAFKFFTISWDDLVMEATLGVPDDQNEPVTTFTYSQQHAPAIYAG